MFTVKLNDREVTLNEITEEEAVSRTLLGSGEGLDLGHCFYMGIKYGKDFSSKVRSYRRIKPENGGAVACSFYE